MFGLFKSWVVSGLTTDGAKLTGQVHTLGYCLSNQRYFNDLNAKEKTDVIAVGKQVVYVKDFFEEYYYRGVKAHHDTAVKFLVMFAALLQGRDGLNWDWYQVRHISQGLYTGMINDKSKFTSINIPLIGTFLAYPISTQDTL